jgi:succinate-semialdehyde dehydrogenase/glutarate-semialdehyde dehydrogenase
MNGLTSEAAPAAAAPHGAMMVVSGRDTEAASGERYAVLNPADGTVVGTAPRAQAADAARVVQAAADALEPWRALPLAERGRVIEAGLEGVAGSVGTLARLLTLEQGKPLPEATAEVEGFVARMRSFVRLAYSTDDGALPLLPSMRRHTFGRMRSPDRGVTVGLVAWNFPVGLMAKKIGPALMAGSTVVIKPAFTTPLAASMVVALMNAAGLPPGVLSAVTGRGDELGAALAAHPAVARVHLTGSDQTGQRLAEATPPGTSDLLLELAGSDAMIVCGDADLRQALTAAVVGRLRNAGQACIAVKRLIVATEVYDEFVAELAALVARREPGPGLVPAQPPHVRIGPLHTAAQRDLVEAQLADAVARGAEVLVGGRRPDAPGLRDGHFFEPTLVANVAPASALVTQEVFGPVLPIFRTDSVERSVDLANDSPWNLNTSIWTRDRATARAVSPLLRCRQVWVNRLPFGVEQAA